MSAALTAIATVALVAIAGALGALGRHTVHQLTCTWRALLVVNTAGSFLLGAIVTADWSSTTELVLGVAFCGALTTFSSFALEVRRLGWPWGPLYALATAIAATAAASIGLAL